MSFRQRITASIPLTPLTAFAAPIAAAFPPPVLRPIRAEDAVIDGTIRRFASDAIIGTSAFGTVTTAVAMTASLVPQDKQAVPREVSLIMFGVVIGGMVLCSYTQMAALRFDPRSRPERHYRNHMIASSGVGVLSLGTGIGGSFCNGKAGLAALFSTSLTLTLTCMLLAVLAHRAADYTDGTVRAPKPQAPLPPWLVSELEAAQEGGTPPPTESPHSQATKADAILNNPPTPLPKLPYRKGTF